LRMSRTVDVLRSNLLPMARKLIPEARRARVFLTRAAETLLYDFERAIFVFLTGLSL
jgi:hypothetical protein